MSAGAGASAVKLQKRDLDACYTRAMLDAPYSGPNSYGPTYREHREYLEHDDSAYEYELIPHARELGIPLFATAFDRPSANFLYEAGVPAFKVASGDIQNTPLLDHLAGYGLPLIVSTGTANLHDVDLAVETVARHHSQLALLQCTAAYPAAYHDLNLSVITTYRERYPELVIGLSSHLPEAWDAEAAYVLGARIIEKHVTLSRFMKGTDHAFSLEPEHLAGVIRNLERLHQALGTGEKRRLPCEAGAVLKMGRSIVAAADLPAGHEVTLLDLAFKSPGGGIPPSRWREYVGRKLPAALAEDDPLPELPWYAA